MLTPDEVLVPNAPDNRKSRFKLPVTDENPLERIVLSERDTIRVLQLLETPPKPTAALMAAARRRASR